MNDYQDNNEKDYHNPNEFEKDLENLREWQDNQYNPGYYIGTGRVPRPIAGLSKYPIILILIGFMFLIPLIFSVVNEYINNHVSIFDIIISNLFPMLFSFIFIIGGILRLKR